jgi:diguanylate cyclase
MNSGESTGAAPPSSIVERLQAGIADATRSGESIAFLLVHSAAVDRIDALQGYVAGDRMSDEIAYLVRTKALRARDVMERLARDELACVLRPAPSDGIAMLAAHRIMSVLAPPLQFSGRPIAADIAIGIAMFPQHGTDAGELLRVAKQALHDARERHDRICLYAPQVAAGNVMDQLGIERRLREAIGQNSLTLSFQPQLDLRSDRIRSAEALLRWDDAVLGPIGPEVAVQAAEAAGIMDELSMWAVTSAVKSCREFQTVAPDFAVSINISPSNLREVDLPYFIDRALRTWGVRGESIVIEITETAMMFEQAVSHEALRQLKTYGVRLSVDDFGTGYSSMVYLAQLPLDELKIDLSFVRGMFDAPQNAKIVRSLIDLAHNLELTVVAEGVENRQILDALKHLGCDVAQGYEIGKPVPAGELLEKIRAQRA